MATGIDHIRELESVALGAPSHRDAAVVRSWRRCLDDYRLDPARACEAYIVPRSRLREHRERAEGLIRTARSGIETLHQQLAGLGYVLLLSDDRGVTVDFIGDPAFDGALQKAGLYLGSEWSERRAGTCAVGACLVTGEPLTIHQSDHFDVTHVPLTCSAAPIYDSLGNLAAVLDVSALRSAEAKTSQNLVLHMVSATARRIELATLMAQARGEWVIRFSRSPEFIEVDPDGAVAIDGSGCITATTHLAQRMLCEAVGQGVAGASGGVIGRRLSDFLDVDPDDLPSLTRSRAARDRLVLTRGGGAVFAHAIAPQPVVRAPQRRPVPPPLAALSGGDAVMDAAIDKAFKLSRTDLPILICGETGSGKERMARAIHECRGRRGRFVAVNCAAIPESLIENELFGHAPGAFTGAVGGGHKGLIREADGGTLFLDEIGDMPLALQARLLRVIAEREVIPVGGARPVPVDLRIVSATHRDLADLVRQGRFREDLYYRLSGAELALPALRARSDFEWLVRRLLPAGRVVGESARLALIRHDWPGNIRELVNALQFAAAMAGDGAIEAADLPETVLARRAAPVAAAADGPGDDLATVLAACGWNVSQVARRLGVDRTTVHRRMKRLGLVPPNRRHT